MSTRPGQNASAIQAALTGAGRTGAAIGFLHEPKLHRRIFRPLDFSDRLTLNPGYTALLNLRLWEEADRFVVAHPSDRTLIEKHR